MLAVGIRLLDGPKAADTSWKRRRGQPGGEAPQLSKAV
jgi:hypothetical protein